MKIYRAWDSGRNKVKFVYRNQETNNLVIGEEKFDWFFYVKTIDYENNKEFFKKLINQNLINKCEKETNYTRVYIDREHTSDFLNYEMEYVWEYHDKLLNIVKYKLTERGIQHYEADVPLSKRWIITNGIEYAADYRILFIDIETDDENIKGKLVAGEFPILSFACMDHTGKKAFCKAKDRSEEAEKELLLKMAKIINGFDVLVGWNSSMFDEPYIKIRMQRHGIRIDWRKKFWQDHLDIFRKFGQGYASYSLDYVGKKITKRGKVERHERIIDLFLKNPEKLKEYNLEDVALMYDIEKATKYLEVAREINTLGLMPCDDRYISRKIDMLILKQAHLDQNYHFKSVERGEEEVEDSKFEGAFVVEPLLGLHRNVYVYDFSSLYPSVMRTLNVSPDTLIEGDMYVPENMIINHPIGTKFRKDYIGIIPKIITMIQDNRNHYKKLMKTVPVESEEHKTYDRLQYAWKMYGLSFYGCIGNKHARFYDTRVAESVTLGGQFYIKKIIEYFQQIGEDKVSIVYGDTDSTFVKYRNKIDATLNDKILSNIKRICENYSLKKFNADNSYLEMSFDKGFETFLIVCKKRYAGMANYLDDKYLDTPALYVAGLEYKRTDVCPLVKNKQEELLRMVLGNTEVPKEKLTSFIIALKQYVFSKDIKLEDFTFGQKLTKDVSEYKTKTMHTKVVDEMNADDKEVWIGDKILYFIESVDSDGKPVPKPLYKYRGVMAREYIWNKKIFPPLKRILDVIMPKVNWGAYEFQSVKQFKNTLMGAMDLW
jgi:DNA polymerase, archaea type